MKIVIKNSLLDLLAFGKHLKIREKLFSTASSEPKAEGKVHILSRQLHPDMQDLIIEDVIDESSDMRSFILRPASDLVKIAPFRAGQYLVLSFEEDGLILKRPYSIASSPSESNEGNLYRISIKRKTVEMDGYFSDSVFRNWKKGLQLKASGPQGFFYYDSLRDADTLVCIAGGSGITPFRSIIPELLEKQPDLKILLFYGFNGEGDDVFSSDFKAYAKESSQSFSYFPVPMDSQGVLSSTIIKDALNQVSGVDGGKRKDASFFICGPPALHSHIDNELISFSLRPKFIRRESFGCGIDQSKEAVKEYKLFIRGGDDDLELKALSNETLLTALERGGVDAPSSCRAGECGWCRSLLLSGEISADQGLTGIRQADKKFGWIHPCVSYPLGNIIIRVPENPEKVVK
jgi:ferredoxin-NADP reductase